MEPDQVIILLLLLLLLSLSLLVIHMDTRLQNQYFLPFRASTNKFECAVDPVSASLLQNHIDHANLSGLPALIKLTFQ